MPRYDHAVPPGRDTFHVEALITRVRQVDYAANYEVHSVPDAFEASRSAVAGELSSLLWLFKLTFQERQKRLPISFAPSRLRPKTSRPVCPFVARRMERDLTAWCPLHQLSCSGYLLLRRRNEGRHGEARHCVRHHDAPEVLAWAKRGDGPQERLFRRDDERERSGIRASDEHNGTPLTSIVRVLDGRLDVRTGGDIASRELGALLPGRMSR